MSTSKMQAQRVAVNEWIAHEALRLAKDAIDAERAEDEAQQEACQHGTWVYAQAAAERTIAARDAFMAHTFCARADAMSNARKLVRAAA